jgi:hypothetical protein
MLRPRARAWIVFGGLGALCVAITGLVVWWRYEAKRDLAELMLHLPADASALVYIDFDALRQSGVLDMLAGSPVNAEPEYAEFIQKSGFDYRNDLEFALVSVHANERYLLLRGRFDWPRLTSYAQANGGTCHNSFCRVPGSVPERWISFFPMSRRVMAMGIGKDDWAAATLKRQQQQKLPFSLPERPAWLRLQAPALQQAEAFPTGTQLFAKAMQDAEVAVISFGPAEAVLGGASQQQEAFDARLEVVTRSSGDAKLLAAQFREVTSVLAKILSRQDPEPPRSELATVLTGGVFEQRENLVQGRWPVPREFLEALTDTP